MRHRGTHIACSPQQKVDLHEIGQCQPTVTDYNII